MIICWLCSFYVYLFEIFCDLVKISLFFDEYGLFYFELSFILVTIIATLKRNVHYGLTSVNNALEL